MSAWLRNSNSRKSLNIWADDVASEVEKEKSQKSHHSGSSRHRSSTTTTAVDSEGLPVPATHGERYSVGSGRRKPGGARFSVIKLAWHHFKRHLGTGSAPSSSSLHDESAADSMYLKKPERGDRDWVDEVVVDRVWSEEFTSTVSYSEGNGSPAKSSSNRQVSGASDYGSTTGTLLLQDRLWNLVMEIFSSRFEDEKRERHYQQEDWYVKKRLAVWTSCWFLLNWVLGCVFTKLPGRELSLGDKVFLFGVAPALTLPVPVMVLYNWPRDRSLAYQIVLLCSVWCWSFYQIIYMRVCGFYGEHPNCQNKDFLGTFYWTTGLQTVGLFGLKLNRFPAAIGALSFFLFASITIVPVRSIWMRHMINFFLYHSFLIYVHYIRESSERRLYTLRDQLKIQYKATQKAQINERRAADSKRRLTSYVFHDEYPRVRVPLNTALLAVQNMAATGAVPKDQDLEFAALSGSLRTMSQVLNDVLDFNRLDSGRFEFSSKPFAFHQVIRSINETLVMASKSRGLTFECFLDPNIDKIARRLVYEAMGVDKKSIRKHILEHPDVDGVVTGDESRLGQIINNLASNAVKFTPAGGKITMRTQLVLPDLKDHDALDVILNCETTSDEQQKVNAYPPTLVNGDAGNEPPDVEKGQPLSADYLTQHDLITRTEKKAVEHIVVRIEVSDTGCGIKYEEMLQSKLFSAFNQTEQGIQQGGKGTGLGLALVRQIVKFSGGRLGVRSKVGEGSTFWVELPLGVGKRTFATRTESSTNSGLGGDNPGSGAVTPKDGGIGDGDGKGERRRGRSRHRNSEHKGPGTGTTGAKEQHLGLFETPLNDKVGIVAPDAAVALRAKKARSEAMREHQALYSLGLPESMHQTSGVDLESMMRQAPGLEQSHSQESKRNSQDGEPSGPEGCGPICSVGVVDPAPPLYRLETPGGTSVTPKFEPGTPASDLTPSTLVESEEPTSRPTFVRLPSPRSFSSNSFENQPPNTNSTYQTSAGSSISASPMTAFDNSFAAGSPESSTAAVNVEPGLPVLVVDDDPLTRTLMRRILIRLGCEVTLAENGVMALDMILGVKGYAGLPSTPGKEDEKKLGEQKRGDGKEVVPSGKGGTKKNDGEESLSQGVRFQEGLASTSDSAIAALGPPPQDIKYAVVFLDNQMPVMSGVKAVERLRELGRKDFVVGVTGNALLSDQKEYMAAGVDKILTKPVLERALRETLATAEERRKEMRRSSNHGQSTSSCSHDSQSKLAGLSPQPSSTESSQLLPRP